MLRLGDKEDKTTGIDMESTCESLGLGTEEPPSDVIARIEKTYHALLERFEAGQIPDYEEAGINDLIDILAQSGPMAHFIVALEARFDECFRGFALSGEGLDLSLNKHDRLPREYSVFVTGTGTKGIDKIEAIEGPVEFYLSRENDEGDQIRGLAKAFRFDLEMLLEGTLDSLRYWLCSSKYIGPFRSIPGRFFEITSSVGNSTEDAGYRALKSIAEKPELLREIANILRDTLDTPYRLETRKIAPRLDHDREGTILGIEVFQLVGRILEQLSLQELFDWVISDEDDPRPGYLISPMLDRRSVGMKAFRETVAALNVTDFQIFRKSGNSNMKRC